MMRWLQQVRRVVTSGSVACSPCASCPRGSFLARHRPSRHQHAPSNPWPCLCILYFTQRAPRLPCFCALAVLWGGMYASIHAWSRPLLDDAWRFACMCHEFCATSRCQYVHVVVREISSFVFGTSSRPCILPKC
jgi:hypothetical protein